MGWRNALATWLVGPRSARARAQSGTAAATARALAGRGGRLSEDNPFVVLDGPAFLTSPSDPEGNWRALDLDAKTLDTMSPTRLLELLADLSPDVSRALWDYLLLLNPGYEATAYAPGTEEPSADGQVVVDALIARLDDLHGSFDVLIGRLDMGAFLRGAYFAELVLDDAGREAVDLATPDPAWVRFKSVRDPVRGRVWQLGQLAGGEFRPLTRESIRYVPIHPFPGNPYGRPMAAPSLFTSLFLLGLLHDLRRVVQQQGYPRIDVSIALDKLKASMPDDLEGDPEAAKEWVNAAILEVQKVYATLQPDDAYIHADAITVNRPVGTVDAASLGAVEPLIRGLERFLVRALKTMPLLMGTTDGVSEANANRQWEIFAAGVKALQHLKETMLSRLFTLAVQAQGVQATVEVRFAELRAAEEMRDQQTQALKNANALYQYLCGWTSHEEASIYATGHAPDADAPRQLPSGFGGGAASAAGTDTTTNPDAGSGRGRGRRGLVPVGAGGALPQLPAEVEIGDEDLLRATRAWDDALGDYAGLLDAAVVDA